MRVLFISSGRGGAVSVLVRNQGASLRNEGIDIDYFIFDGNGISGYLNKLPALRRKIREERYDLVHAHYSISAYIATLAGGVPLVVSLMGSDIHDAGISKLFTRFLARRCWKATIVKTERMHTLLGFREAEVIPNGVNLDFFKPEDKRAARKRLGLSESSKIILFVSTHDRPEKNYELARKSVEHLNDEGVELLYLKNTDHSLIPSYLNAADLLLLTSLYEGSPNIIKEAMACNCPVVSTDVGDVNRIIGSTEGCYLAMDNAEDIAEKIGKVLGSVERTKGRERIIELGLDSRTVAQKIAAIYKSVTGA